MKIGILGSGSVAQTLAVGFLKYSYEVTVGTRTPSKLSEWHAKSAPKAKIGSFADAASSGQILVLAVKGLNAKEALEMAGSDNLSGKIIIDATNPIAPSAPENGVLKFFTNLDESLMEQLQRSFPEAKFVKAFSCVGAALMVDPDFSGVKPTMFICGNESSAKAEVTNILVQFGHDVDDMGTVEAARAIEPLCILWCIPGFLKNDWMHAFKMLRK